MTTQATRLRTVRRLATLAALACLPTAHAREPMPPRLSSLMEPGEDWRQNTQGTLAPQDTLLGQEQSTSSAASFQPVADPLPAAFTPSGGAYTVGYNVYGQLGNGTTTNQSSFVQVSGLGSNVTAIAQEYNSGLAIVNGGVLAWGRNSYGQLGDGTTTDRLTPVQVPGLTSGVTAIAGGGPGGLAIQNGALYSWGANLYGELGNGTTNGNQTGNTPGLVNGMGSGVTLVAAGFEHVLALQNGAVYAWGYNFYGELGNGTSGSSTAANPTPAPVIGLGAGSGVTALAAGAYHSLAIVNGGVVAWGNNTYGQLGNGGGGSGVVSATPGAVLGLSTGVTAIAGGQYHSLALQNGNVFAWGLNSSGQLGNGTTNSAVNGTPFQVDPADLKNIYAVGAGFASSYALAQDGSLWVWGLNSRGQLGLGNTTNYSTPQHLLPPPGQYYQLIGSNNDSTYFLAILGSTPPVPEPATWLGGLGLLGAAGLALRRRVRRA